METSIKSDFTDIFTEEKEEIFLARLMNHIPQGIIPEAVVDFVFMAAQNYFDINGRNKAGCGVDASYEKVIIHNIVTFIKLPEAWVEKQIVLNKEKHITRRTLARAVGLPISAGIEQIQKRARIAYGLRFLEFYGFNRGEYLQGYSQIRERVSFGNTH